MKLVIQQTEGSDIHIPGEGENGYQDLQELIRIYENSLYLFIQKNEEYGGVWIEQGWMGNLARILSKAGRLRNMLWGESVLSRDTSDDETVQDTALDCINLLGFFVLNYTRGNRWGDRRHRDHS